METWVFVLIAVIVVIFMILSIFIPLSPDFAKPSCIKCGNTVKWQEGKDDGNTGEALFKCNKCGYTEHRGGPSSEILMESWKDKK